MGGMQGFSVAGKGAVLVNFPTLSEWKRLSCVGSPAGPPFRRNDPGLVRIDALVEAYNNAKNTMAMAGERQYLLGELFVACVRWLNGMKFDIKVEQARRSAVMSLSFTTSAVLAAAFQCSANEVGPRLINMFGKTMDISGIGKDASRAASIYLDDAKRQQWRVVFRAARAYKFSENPNPKAPLELLDTEDYGKKMEKWDGETRNGGGYVLSTSDELYVAPLTGKSMTKLAEDEGIPVFHSGFMGGAPVQCAGMIVIKQGVVKEIYNNSGHYLPVDTALVRMLRLCEAVGMSIKDIEVSPMGAGGTFKGDVFLKENGNWEKIRKAACQSLWTRYSAATNKETVLRQLVTERFNSLMNAFGVDHKAKPGETSTKRVWGEQEAWKAAYQGICWDLALWDPTMRARANRPPIPRVGHLVGV